MAELWREVLGVDQVSRDDNFFDLGGHSLLLIQLHGKLQKLVRDDIRIVDLFRFPTVAELAEHVAGDSRESEDSFARQVGMRREAARRGRRRVARSGAAAKGK